MLACKQMMFKPGATDKNNVFNHEYMWVISDTSLQKHLL